jgi:hypothetical protein
VAHSVVGANRQRANAVQNGFSRCPKAAFVERLDLADKDRSQTTASTAVGAQAFDHRAAWRLAKTMPLTAAIETGRHSA